MNKEDMQPPFHVKSTLLHVTFTHTRHFSTGPSCWNPKLYLRASTSVSSPDTRFSRELWYHWAVSLSANRNGTITMAQIITAQILALKQT